MVFDARLRALNPAHDVLVASSWTSAPMSVWWRPSINALSNRRGGASTSMDRPSTSPAKQALSLSARPARACHQRNQVWRLVHTPSGTIDVSQDVQTLRNRSGPSFSTGENAAAPLSRRRHTSRFGSRLIESTLSSDFGTSVKVEYLSEGVVCSFETRLSDLAEAAAQQK